MVLPQGGARTSRLRAEAKAHPRSGERVGAIRYIEGKGLDPELPQSHHLRQVSPSQHC